MTKRKSTKRALLLSALSLLMCVSMLIGSTYAWFTDSVTSGSNVIKSGSLKITMEWKDATTNGIQNTYKDASQGAIFNYKKWEPGYVEAKNIKIDNAGTLALKYQLNILATGAISELADVIDVYYAEGEISLAGREMTNLTKIGTLSQVLDQINTTASGDLLEGETDYVTLALKMQEGAGNEYQGLDIGSEFAVQLLATQLTSEFDSFDNQYDKDAVYGDVMVSTNAELKAAIEDSAMKVIAVNGDLTYDWGSESYGNSKALLMKGKTFLGANEAATITFAGYGSANPIVDATFRNITIKDTTVGDNEASWEHGYLEFENLTAVNVTFADSIMLDGDNSLMNCAMNNTVTSWYGIWIEGGNTVIKNSSFRGTRSVKIHEAYGTDVESVVIDNCVFGSLSEKPGVVIGDLNAATKVTIKNSTFVNCQKGDQNKYIYESDTDVTKFAFAETNNEVVGNVTTVADANEILGATKGGDLFLTDDVNYNNTDPEKQLILEATTAINFDGNGSTITTEGADPSIGNHGYVAFVPPVGENVTVSDVTITGEGFVGLGDYSQKANKAVANNLVIKNLASSLSNKNGGDLVGCAFMGYANEIELNNCVMTGTTSMVGGTTIPYDAGFGNKTNTVINGGEYGNIRVWEQAHVTIKGATIDKIDSRAITYKNLGMLTIGAGTHVGTINLIPGDIYTPALVIEDGATVDAIVYNGTTYTVAEWNAYLATL